MAQKDLLYIYVYRFRAEVRHFRLLIIGILSLERAKLPSLGCLFGLEAIPTRIFARRKRMSLKTRFVRNGQNKIIGSVTTGYSDTSSLVRDGSNQIIGRTNERLRTTRDVHNKLVSTNTADPGLLIGRKK